MSRREIIDYNDPQNNCLPGHQLWLQAKGHELARSNITGDNEALWQIKYTNYEITTVEL